MGYALEILRFVARHGRVSLILGLIGGFALPGVALAMKPALPFMVAFLVFVSALRIGARAALGNLRQAGGNLGLVLVLQLAMPLAALGLLSLISAPLAVTLAVIFALSASSISGSPAFSVMLGHDPAPAMRLLILGTALLPLTILPVFWLAPGLGGAAEVALAALRLTLVIALSVAAAFALRRRFFPDPAPETIQALDGLAALTLAVIVIGLMSAVGPVLRSNPASLIFWISLAFALNFGSQFISYALLRGKPGAVPVSVIAGNRNIALFLVGLPAAVTDPVLIFIGCYQIPMYLTPLLMRKVYANG